MAENNTVKLSDISEAWMEWRRWIILLKKNPNVWCFQFGACQAQATLVIKQAQYFTEVKP